MMSELADIQSLKALKLAKQSNQYIGDLYNPNTITLNTWINGSAINSSTTYSTTDFIPVTSNVQYMATSVHSIAQFDSNKTYIGGTNGYYSTSRKNLTFRSNYNASYVRISTETGDLQSGSYHVVPVKNPSKWVAKAWGALGDSITQYNMWQPYVQDMHGVTMYNYGSAGTTLADATGSNTTAMCRPERINQITNLSSLITVMGGTNDWAQNITIGNINDTVTNTYMGALNTLVKTISSSANYSSARLVLLTPPFGIQPNKSGWADTSGLKNNLGFTLGDYGQAMMQVARANNVPVIDLYNNCGWNLNNYSTYLLQDMNGSIPYYLHPNDTGGRRIAEIINGALRNIEPTA